MKVTMMLADAAQAVTGKLYILGGGWSLTGPNPTPMAIAVKIEVPWDQANDKHDFKLSLYDADGKSVKVEEKEDGEPIEISGIFEAGRPPGLIPGTPLDVSLAINLPPIALKPGSRYAWQLFIDNETKEEWRAGFSTRA